jgi:DNA uptake protein ComE-like DNA-binding protein
MLVEQKSILRIRKMPTTELLINISDTTNQDNFRGRLPNPTSVAMDNKTEQKISLNTATPKQLTQLPGIAKDTAYRLVNHRKRHGFFTHWEELAEVREFPVDKIDEIKKSATLKCPPARIVSARVALSRQPSTEF